MIDRYVIRLGSYYNYVLLKNVRQANAQSVVKTRSQTRIRLVSVLLLTFAYYIAGEHNKSTYTYKRSGEIPFFFATRVDTKYNLRTTNSYRKIDEYTCVTMTKSFDRVYLLIVRSYPIPLAVATISYRNTINAPVRVLLHVIYAYMCL